MVEALVVERLSLGQHLLVAPLIPQTVGSGRKVVVTVSILRIGSNYLLEPLQGRRVLPLLVKLGARCVVSTSRPLAPYSC